VSRFIQCACRVLQQRRLARDTYLIRLETPEIAAAIRPGQFVMLRLPGRTDPLLGRPFALYDTVLDGSGQAIGIDVVYLVVGKMTGLLPGLGVGDTVEAWGPLGNGFPEPQTAGHVGVVAGGIGQTPFLAHIRELLGTRGYAGEARRRVQKVSVFYGVRTGDLAAGVDDFQQAGAAVHLASNDGSIGYRGFVTALLEETRPFPEHLFGCGPEPMLHALADVARRRGVACHLSLETPMACGVGICFSCVTKVKTADGWDYKRVCVDGPVFDAAALVW
jgi:dihydroorotate dehydrogenase electron transfer subunit